MMVELRKSKYRGRQIIVADGEEVGSVLYDSKGSGRWVFYHPAPRHGAVCETGTRIPIAVPTREDVLAMATTLAAAGTLKPVAHWRAWRTAEDAKRKAAEEKERAKERVAAAAPTMLAALKKAEFAIGFHIERHPGHAAEAKIALPIVQAAIALAEKP